MASLDDYDLLGTPEGGLLRIHGLNVCKGERCVVHNPTDHLMRTWPLYYQEHTRWLAYRECPHGLGHPDPDSLDYFTRLDAAYMGVHTCDGCCSEISYDA